MRLATRFVVAALVCAAHPALSQEGKRVQTAAQQRDSIQRELVAHSVNQNPVLFLERAYFSPASPFGKKLVFEGQPTAHYFLFNGHGDETWQRHGGWSFAMPISELFVVRMETTPSNPVLTPSFHIGGRLQAIHLRRDAANPLAFSMLNVMTGIIHYSNGQAGCTYLGSDRLPNGDCAIVDTSLAARQIANTMTGDFSTTYIPLNVAWRMGRLVPGNNRLKWQQTVGFEVQYHPFTTKLPGAALPHQAETYGQHEASVFTEFECRRKAESGIWRLATKGTTRFGDGYKPISHGMVEGSFVFEGNKVGNVWSKLKNVKFVRAIRVRHAGLFVRFNKGFDYYNIRYQDDSPFWSLGFILDPLLLDGLDRVPETQGDIKIGNCLPNWPF